MIGIFKDYIEKRVNLLKIEMTENTVKAISLIGYIFLLLILITCLFLFLFVGVGFILGNILGNYAYGFLIISALFLLCLLIISFQKRKIIAYFREKLVQTIFNEE